MNKKQNRECGDQLTTRDKNRAAGEKLEETRTEQHEMSFEKQEPSNVKRYASIVQQTS